MKKRIIAFVLTLVLAIGSFGGVGVMAETGLNEDNMKEMILLVKEKLNIGDEYTEFDYDYNENGSSNTWYFRWSDKQGEKNISVTCDEKGHIENYFCYDYSEKNVIPEYTKSELKDKAVEWIAKIEPEISDKLELKSASYERYQNCYRYVFVRTENGYRVPDNMVSITITTDGKEVTGYGERWDYDVKFAKVTDPISRDKAVETVKSSVRMNLEYRLGWDEEGNEKVFLAYAPDKSYIAVSAKNGKVFNEKTYFNAKGEDMGVFDEALAMADEESENGAYLSEAELAEASEIKFIISAEKAVELIKNNEKLLVDENFTDINTCLYKNDENYYWSISMEDNRPIDWENGDYYRSYVSAKLDAKTGELISFYANVKGDSDASDEVMEAVETKYSKKQCREKLEAFLNDTIPDKFASTKLGKASKGYLLFSDYSRNIERYGGYSFSYDRYNEEVPFYANKIYGSVDAVTGKIYEFSYNWTDAELPSTKGVIGESAAFDKYIGYDGFDLVYELISNYKDTSGVYKYEIEINSRLVYRTAINPYYVEAFTGKQLYYDGTEYVKRDINYAYNDIEGTKYERVISLLADMGIGFEGESFKPDDAITIGEFNKLIESSNGYGYVLEPSNKKSKKNDTKLLTRQKAAGLLAEMAGMGEVAKMDIFKTGYSDEKKINKQYIGSVALMKGFGIMGAKKGKKFMPNAKLTRGEAAEIVFNLLVMDSKY